MTIESGGSVWMRPYVLPADDSGDVDAVRGLTVASRRFEVASITPSSPYPGTTNCLTVSFSTTVALQGEPEGQVRRVKSIRENRESGTKFRSTAGCRCGS